MPLALKISVSILGSMMFTAIIGAGTVSNDKVQRVLRVIFMGQALILTVFNIVAVWIM